MGVMKIMYVAINPRVAGSQPDTHSQRHGPDRKPTTYRYVHQSGAYQYTLR